MQKNLTYNNINIILKNIENIYKKENIKVENTNIYNYQENYNKMSSFIKENYSKIIELIDRWYISVESVMENFDFKDKFLYENSNDFYISITSKWKNFLAEYKHWNRRFEYDYKDTTFFWKILFLILWWILWSIITILIKNFNF